MGFALQHRLRSAASASLCSIGFVLQHWLTSISFALQYWPSQQKFAKTQAQDACVFLAQRKAFYSNLFASRCVWSHPGH
jgi:hypothetical protein